MCGCSAKLIAATLASSNIADHGAGRQGVVHAVAAQTEAEVDAKRLEDREQWYVARFCADDAPDWNAAQFVSRYPPSRAVLSAAARPAVILSCHREWDRVGTIVTPSASSSMAQDAQARVAARLC